MSTGTETTAEAEASPCKCMSNWAYIAPAHAGHCCFRSPSATCHVEEFEAWKARDHLGRK